MKKMKKLASVALALVMALALMAPAFAAGNNTITVTNAEKGAEYTLYKIFDAKVSDDRAEATGEDASDVPGITYQLTSGTTMPTQLDSVFQLDAANKTIVKKGNPSDADIMAAVKAYAEATPSAKVGDTVTNTAGGAVVFNGLEDGYYAVLSNVSNGASVTITSVAPNARVIEKNSENIDPDPMNSSKTLVDANGNTLTDKTVSIGETVHYMIKTTATNWVDKNNDTTDGAEHKITSYTVKDQGATFLNNLKIDSITVVSPDGNTKTSVKNFPANATSYEIPWVDADGNHLYASGSEIQVMYSATVNANILTATNATNKGWITPNGYTDPDPENPDIPHEDVHTYGFGLMKTKADNTLLNGAQFTLWNGNDDDATQIAVIYDTTNKCYRPVVEGETATEITAGNVQIKGLANGTYYLKETVAPDGYNAIEGFTEQGATINNDNNFVQVNTEIVNDEEVTTYVSGGLKVVNEQGAVLPSTGGMGTTIFYAVGGVLLVGSAVLFVTKKRLGE